MQKFREGYKRTYLTPIKPMFVVFADTWQSNVAIYTKTPIKEML